MHTTRSSGEEKRSPWLSYHLLSLSAQRLAATAKSSSPTAKTFLQLSLQHIATTLPLQRAHRSSPTSQPQLLQALPDKGLNSRNDAADGKASTAWSWTSDVPEKIPRWPHQGKCCHTTAHRLCNPWNLDRCEECSCAGVQFNEVSKESCCKPVCNCSFAGEQRALRVIRLSCTACSSRVKIEPLEPTCFHPTGMILQVGDHPKVSLWELGFAKGHAWKFVEKYPPKWWFDGDLPWCDPLKQSQIKNKSKKMETEDDLFPTCTSSRSFQHVLQWSKSTSW